MEGSPPAGASPTAPWLQNVTFHGLLASLTPLIPLPLLDDWAERWVAKRLIRETLRIRGFAAATWHVEVLAWDGQEGKPRGCLFPLVVSFKVALYVLKKIFRKLLVFLLVKDCVDRFSNAFHQGYLLHVAFERAVIDRQVLAGGERLIEVRQAILSTCEVVDPRLLNQLVRRVLLGGRRGLVERMSGALWGNAAYRAELERVFAQKLANRAEETSK